MKENPVGREAERVYSKEDVETVQGASTRTSVGSEEKAA